MLYSAHRQAKQVIPAGNSVGGQDAGKEENMDDIIELAYDAGEEALVHLRRAEDLLDKASAWGVWDIIGGGLLSSLFKHSRMDDAESELNQARSALRRYCSKLEGIASPEHINVQPGALLSFADCLCDGFLADVLVQSHIEVARRQLQEAIDAVRTSQRQLRALL